MELALSSVSFSTQTVWKLLDLLNALEHLTSTVVNVQVACCFVNLLIVRLRGRDVMLVREQSRRGIISESSHQLYWMTSGSGMKPSISIGVRDDLLGRHHSKESL